ncbi:MAG: LytTR family transcriptional regulator [Clostridia bacterium]|nr:LytTR family transcriptional regulator [Clostridia bacterium]
MKIRTVIRDGENEIVIYSARMTPRVKELYQRIGRLVSDYDDEKSRHGCENSRNKLEEVRHGCENSRNKLEEVRHGCENESEAAGGRIAATVGRETHLIDPSMVSAFISEEGGVYAILNGRRIALKERLYVLEERYGDRFMRVSQSCLANIGMIDRFEATFGASLAVIFKDGYRDIVSRRQLKQVKERIGF